MGKKASFAGALCEKLELPGEALGAVKLSVIGTRRALIENHKGLLICTGERIAVRTPGGALEISGEELEIEAMNGTDLLIAGKMRSAAWEGEEGR